MLGRIDALAWTPEATTNGGRLYFSAGESIKQYNVNFYSKSIDVDQRADDPVVDVASFGAFDIAWCGGALYTATSQGVVRHFDGAPIANLSAMSLLCAPGGGPLIITTADGRWLQADLVNRVTSAPPLYGDAIAWRADGTMVVYRRGGEVRTLVGAMPCPLDQFSPLGSNACISVQCIRSEPCGPNSAREAGDEACMCAPGFFMSGKACVPCTPQNYYCSGGRAAQCPENSATIATTAASSVADCLCIRGFYRYADSLCLPCPSNQWCPFDGTVAPVPCRGSTNGGGMSSPIDCSCPPRTYGIECLPCDDDVDCSSPMVPQPQLLATGVVGWGPPDGGDIMGQCSDAAQWKRSIVTYSLRVPPYLLPGSGALRWGWVVVSAPDDAAWSNVTLCLVSHGFLSLSIKALGPPRAAVGVNQAIKCTAFGQEWNGLTASQSQCGCIAGYEPLKTPSWGTQCFPCLNGTFRARRSNGGCIACPTNEAAPSMGMAQCVCQKGYERNDNNGECVAAPNLSDPPPWTSPMIVIGTAGGCGLMAFALAAAFLLI